MSDCPPLDQTFHYKPSVYLSVDISRTYYTLYVSVTMPAKKTLEKLDQDVVSVLGAVRYLVVEDLNGCDETWEFQEIIHFELNPNGPVEERRIGVEVLQEVDNEENKGKAIVHHADADEAGIGGPNT